MSYRCQLYGLGVLADKIIPGVPPSLVSKIDLRVNLGSIPHWLDDLSQTENETVYVTDYRDESGDPLLRVFRLQDGYFKFAYADQTTFLIDQNGTEVWARWSEPLALEDTATYLLGPIMGFVMLLRGVFSLHASAIAIGNVAIAVMGPAGSGKSTTAAAFSTMGYPVLAEDVVTLDDCGDHFLVKPAYPCIRLWPASVKALFGSETHLPLLTPNWNKRYLDLSQNPDQFQQQPLPLAAIYQLDERQDETSAPYISSLDPSQGMIALVANTYSTRLMDKQMRAREFSVLSRLINDVPLRRVTPHASVLRIPDLCDCIIKDFAKLNSSHPTRATCALHV